MIPLPAEVAVIMALLHSISFLMQIALGVVFTVLILTVRKRQTTSHLMVPRGKQTKNTLNVFFPNSKPLYYDQDTQAFRLLASWFTLSGKRATFSDLFD